MGQPWKAVGTAERTQERARPNERGPQAVVSMPPPSVSPSASSLGLAEAFVAGACDAGFRGCTAGFAAAAMRSNIAGMCLLTQEMPLMVCPRFLRSIPPQYRHNLR